MSALIRTLAVVLSAAVLWGCAAPGPTTTGGDAGAATGEAPEAVEVGEIDSGLQPSAAPMDSSLLSTRTVYFDFDKSAIKPEARKIIEAHARHLADNPNIHITLEGHCDERGTREYNLGLGERRAKAVRQVMTLMGASSSQLELVSYGEERPAAMGHDESAWELNRRVEFIY